MYTTKLTLSLPTTPFSSSLTCRPFVLPRHVLRHIDWLFFFVCCVLFFPLSGWVDSSLSYFLLSYDCLYPFTNASK